MKRIISITVLFLLFTVAVNAQLNFIFLPELYGRNVDGLGNFQVQNVGTVPMTGRVSISVKETSTGLPVVVITTPFVAFYPGVSNFPRSTYSSSAFNFSANSYGALANQTRALPPGEYNFCFRFVPHDKTLFNESETCFDGDIQPVVPLTLINPMHLDTLCNKRPVLSWQPPIPFTAGMRFRLILTEKKSASATEDLLMKAPTLLLDNISTTTINYPSVNPELKEGSSYYWQVAAYEKGVIISRSEPWEFTVQCKEATKPGPNDSYRELKLLVNGNYYIANRALKFSFRNDYNVQKLRYAILDIGEGSKEVKHLPEIKLQQGLNKIDIDLGDLDLKPGSHYILKVYPFNEPAIEVRFMYEEKDID